MLSSITRETNRRPRNKEPTEGSQLHHDQAPLEAGPEAVGAAHPGPEGLWHPVRWRPVPFLMQSRGGATRTLNRRFWRPVLCQLSYAPVERAGPLAGGKVGNVLLGDALPTGSRPQDWPSSCGSLVDNPFLPYARLCRVSDNRADGKGYHSRIFVTTPEPTVRPPSRMAKRRFSSIAIGESSSSFTVILTLSPGIHISTPSGSVTVPVTSVVRK